MLHVSRPFFSHSLSRNLLRAAAPAADPGRIGKEANQIVKQLRKNQLPGGKHHASEGRASAKTTPNNCLTCRLKS